MKKLSLESNTFIHLVLEKLGNDLNCGITFLEVTTSISWEKGKDFSFLFVKTIV